MKSIYQIYSKHYVAAIVQGTTEMIDFMSTVPRELRDELKIEQLGGVEYPFSIVEAKTPSGRIFITNRVGREVDLKIIKNMCKNEGFKVLAIYRIEKDFLGNPHSPGEDYMGVLDHEHANE
jgi:hypothetical protein